MNQKIEKDRHGHQNRFGKRTPTKAQQQRELQTSGQSLADFQSAGVEAAQEAAGQKAEEWARKLDENYINLMGISEDTQVCQTYSCGHTIKIKKVVVDEEIPENLKKLMKEYRFGVSYV